jgi:hypothetical protein
MDTVTAKSLSFTSHFVCSKPIDMLKPDASGLLEICHDDIISIDPVSLSVHGVTASFSGFLPFSRSVF